jgi:hypothetical protein
MKNIEYEWVVEEIDQYDDIIGVYHFPKFKDTLDIQLTNRHHDQAVKIDVALVLDDWNYKTEGRYWAYIQEDGSLPKVFLDAYGNKHDYKKVPKRFINEVIVVDDNTDYKIIEENESEL